MENQMSPERIANAIMMDKTFYGYYLIVEGVKDYKLFNKYIQQACVKIKPAFGWEKVIAIIDILNNRNYFNKLAIIDSDFNQILGIEYSFDELFLTDFHDIEVMILQTQALEAILDVFAAPNRIQDFEEKNNMKVRDVIFALALEIAFLKLANKIHELGLVFKPEKPEGNQIKYRDFIDDKNLSFRGRPALVESLLNYSRSKTKLLKPQEEILQRIEEIALQGYDINHLVNGHDLSNILYILLKKVFSSTNKMLNDFASVEDSLILAYEYDYFKASKLYNDINAFARSRGITFWR